MIQKEDIKLAEAYMDYKGVIAGIGSGIRHSIYHLDWNEQIRLFSKLAKEMLAIPMSKRMHKYPELVKYWTAAVVSQDPAAGFKIIIENLKWLQQQKGTNP